jgi:hypothetical protein
LEGWKEKFFSQAGKEILLKAVVQAILTYAMSVFLLPKTLCKSLNSLMSIFWWGLQSNGNKVLWMSWERMGTSKLSGGMRFRDLEMFNLALLAKQGWRLFRSPNSLVAWIMAEKYYFNGSFLQTSLGGKPSYAWRSILKARPVLVRGLGWRVGNEADIKTWGDKWIPSPTNFQIQTQVRVLHPDAKVADLSLLIQQQSGGTFSTLGRFLSKKKLLRYAACQLVLY